MFRYYDYNDLLEYFFMTTGSYEIVDIKNFNPDEILID